MSRYGRLASESKTPIDCNELHQSVPVNRMRPDIWMVPQVCKVLHQIIMNFPARFGFTDDKTLLTQI